MHAVAGKYSQDARACSFRRRWIAAVDRLSWLSHSALVAGGHFTSKLTDSFNFVVCKDSIEHRFVYFLVRFTRFRSWRSPAAKLTSLQIWLRKIHFQKKSELLVRMLVPRGSIQTYFNEMLLHLWET